jgi:phosphoserine phosphatase
MADAFSPGLMVQGLKAPLSLKHFKLAVLDMDSTLINIECIDEIAQACGKKNEVSAITEAAMRGEITDFGESLRQRVALLAGVHVSALERVLSERLRLNPGAEKLLQTLLQAGLHTMLVSGGFTFFANHVQTQLGMHEAHANVLQVNADGRLSGAVLGDIIDGQTKKKYLLERCQTLGCTPQQALAVGDGANDLPMMSAAGLSVAYHAKPKVREQAMVAINDGGLDRLLELFTS